MKPASNRFTAEEKMQAAQREVALRRAVYPHQALHGKLTSSEALRQIEIMEEIVADYAKLVDIDVDQVQKATQTRPGEQESEP